MAFDLFNDENKTVNYAGITIGGGTMDSILKSNGIIKGKNSGWYDKFIRFGGVDPSMASTDNREYLFFTKPDLNIFSGSEYNTCQLNSELSNIPLFIDMAKRYKRALTQLQYSIQSPSGGKNPFMCILSNAVTSKLDLPGIQADTQESAVNDMGTSIQYRSHSMKSDNGYDFSLSFLDSPYLEIYYMVKAYDEYMRLCKRGLVTPKKEYILNNILQEQFSVYKIIVADDAETILYFAKVTGVFFTDVPRSDFGDISKDGIKYSLNFHGQFVEDSSPVILSDFNSVSPGSTANNFIPTYSDGMINNQWAAYPVIIKSQSTKRSRLGMDSTVYKLRWTNVRKN